MFKRFFDYYGFTKAEQRGFFILTALICIVLVFQFCYDYFDRSDPIEHHIAYFSTAEIAEEADGEMGNELTSPPIYEKREPRKEINYFFFDPNGLPAEKWVALGFSEKQAAVIKNYEAKGGKFYKKEDVAKMYVISDKDYERIAPYIVIQSPLTARTESAKIVESDEPTKSESIPIVIDINQADTLEFKRLRGIGTVLAARAVRYREALGGYHSVAQIAEVYGLSPEVFQHIEPSLTVAGTSVKKLNINSASEDQLSSHPYISKKYAQLIVNFRKQHGEYKDFTDLRQIHALNEDFLRKIEPYIEW